MVVQQSVELVLQFVNVAFYLVPNVYSLVQKCQWGSNVVGAQHAPLQTNLWIFTLAEQILPGSTVLATAGQCLRRGSLELVVHCKGMPYLQQLSLCRSAAAVILRECRTGRRPFAFKQSGRIIRCLCPSRKRKAVQQAAAGTSLVVISVLTSLSGDYTGPRSCFCKYSSGCALGDNFQINCQRNLLACACLTEAYFAGSQDGSASSSSHFGVSQVSLLRMVRALYAQCLKQCCRRDAPQSPRQHRRQH